MTEVTAPWDIDPGIENARRFFQLVPKVFPEATLFVAEGGRITSAVIAVYRQHSTTATNIPELQGLTLRNRHICRFSPELFRDLARLARESSRTALLDHLSLYQNERWLLEWHDAFANAILLDATLPEATIAALAHPFRVRYGRAHFRAP